MNGLRGGRYTCQVHVCFLILQSLSYSKFCIIGLQPASFQQAEHLENTNCKNKCCLLRVNIFIFLHNCDVALFNWFYSVKKIIFFSRWTNFKANISRPSLKNKIPSKMKEKLELPPELFIFLKCLLNESFCFFPQQIINRILYFILRQG